MTDFDARDLGLLDAAQVALNMERAGEPMAEWQIRFTERVAIAARLQDERRARDRGFTRGFVASFALGAIGVAFIEAWLFATIGWAWWLGVHGALVGLLTLVLVCSSHDPEREWAMRKGGR